MPGAASPGETVTLDRISFSDVAGWGEDALDDAFRAFCAGAPLIAGAAPATRLLGIGGERLRRVAEAALRLADDLGRDEARGFFERHFAPRRISRKGFVTAYFEPVVPAARKRSQRFATPLYRRPDDLVEVTDANRPGVWDPDMRFGRQLGDTLVPYFDRAAIEGGALAGRGLEIAWLEDAVDAFFLHVQGSARLSLEDGSLMRVAYDGKAGHGYTSIGRLAVERGLLPREEAHKDGLEAWLKAHRAEGEALMRENRSFIFFRETRQATAAGPIGAAGLPLWAGRSLAVDRTLHTFHTPVWIDAPALRGPEGGAPPFRRLMIAHDTGSAIVGPARGDLFYGSGAEAGSRAGRVAHEAGMVVLAPLG